MTEDEKDIFLEEEHYNTYRSTATHKHVKYQYLVITKIK